MLYNTKKYKICKAPCCRGFRGETTVVRESPTYLELQMTAGLKLQSMALLQLPAIQLPTQPCKRQLNQGSFVLLYFTLFTLSDLYWVGLSVFSCTVLFVSISQVIGCEDRLRNDLYRVEWGVKLYSDSWTRREIRPVDWPWHPAQRRGQSVVGVNLAFTTIPQRCRFTCGLVEQFTPSLASSARV